MRTEAQIGPSPDGKLPLAHSFLETGNEALHVSTVKQSENGEGWVVRLFNPTGGTLSGAGKVLKAARPDIQIIAAEPEQASLLKGDDWNPHMIQGWTPDFVPEVLDPEVADRIVPVNQDKARDNALALAQQEGLFVGVSAGATLTAALEVAEDAPEGSVMVVMLPDTAERYMSTFLFEGIEEGSDDEWLASL